MARDRQVVGVTDVESCHGVLGVGRHKRVVAGDRHVRGTVEEVVVLKKSRDGQVGFVGDVDRDHAFVVVRSHKSIVSSDWHRPASSQ